MDHRLSVERAGMVVGFLCAVSLCLLLVCAPLLFIVQVIIVLIFILRGATRHPLKQRLHKPDPDDLIPMMTILTKIEHKDDHSCPLRPKCNMRGRNR